MITYGGVLAAAALTTLVTAALAAAITVFMGQGLPLAVQHDLATTPDTAMLITAQVAGPSDATQGSAALRSRIAAAMPGVPFSLQNAFWSDPLELVPRALPALPAGVGKGNTALLQAASMSGIASHAALIAGRWPTTPGSGGQRVIATALPASVAALLHVGVGDVLRLRDRITNAPVSFDITGVFVPRPGSGSADSYWTLSYIPASGMSASGGDVTYGPLVVDQTAFGPALTMLSGSWVAQPDMAAFTDGNLDSMAAGIAALSNPLPNSSLLNGAQTITSLPSVLTGTHSELTVSLSLLVISALELLVLAVAALLAVGRLLAAQREREIAVLVARGATRSQLTRLTAAEVIPLSVLVAVVGGLAGIRLANVLASAGPLGTAGIRLVGRAGTWPDALAAAIVVAVIAAATLLAPGLGDPAAARERSGRQAIVAGVSRAGLDIALLVLAGLAVWQLRQYSAVSAAGVSAAGGNSGTAGIDPVIVLAPALALAAGAVITLRLLPLAARTADRLASRGRGLTASLASWQFSRMPVRQGSAALLLVMAVATGTLALAQHQSWTRSASDQAAFANGGDVQVDPPVPLSPSDAGAVTTVSGVTHALAVAPQIGASPGEVVALNAAQAAQVVKLRGDESPFRPAILFGAITPAGALPGTVLPAAQPGAGASTIQLTATLGPITPGARGLVARLGPFTVTLTILDRTGSAYQITAGTLAADGRPHVLAASLGGDKALYPLRVASITVTYQMPMDATPALTLSVRGLSLAGWTEQASTPDLAGIQSEINQDVAAAPVADDAITGKQEATFIFSPGYGYTVLVGGAGPLSPQRVPGLVVLLPPAAQVAAIPAIATKAFMDANSLAIGSVVSASVQGASVPLRIVAEVVSFPTVTTSGGALITDLGSLQEYLLRQSVPTLPVTGWWLATAGGGVPPALTASVPVGTDITSAAELTAATTGDPLSAAPQLALLAMAAAAAILAITGFWVSIAADASQRRAEAALLAALGVSRRAAALQLCLEKLLLSLPSAVLGVLLGTVVARLLVPAVTLTRAGQRPTPPVLTMYDLPQAIPLALVVVLLPAVTAAFAAARRPDPAADLRAVETA
jgi:ABC-type antimicrobial peptide transport system permease subunit